MNYERPKLCVLNCHTMLFLNMDVTDTAKSPTNVKYVTIF